MLNLSLLAEIHALAPKLRVLAVTKTQASSAIEALLTAGHRDFGENRVQEALQKFLPLRAAYPDLRLHLIGPLQTNKAEEAVRFFDTIETLDRPRLAAALRKAMDKTGRTPRLFIEVNIGEEPQKAGILPAALPSFLKECTDAHGLAIAGLMCIPPQGKDARPFFAALARLSDAHGLPERSMGMSADWREAIAAGATEIRLGSALFGPRQ